MTSGAPRSTSGRRTTIVIVVSAVAMVLGSFAIFVYTNVFSPPLKVDDLRIGASDPVCFFDSPGSYIVQVPIEPIDDSARIDSIELVTPRGLRLLGAELAALPGSGEADPPSTSAEDLRAADQQGSVYLGVDVGPASQLLVLLVEEKRQGAGGTASGLRFERGGEIRFMEVEEIALRLDAETCQGPPNSPTG